MQATITYNGAARSIKLFGTTFKRGKSVSTGVSKIIERAQTTAGFHVEIQEPPKRVSKPAPDVEAEFEEEERPRRKRSKSDAKRLAALKQSQESDDE